MTEESRPNYRLQYDGQIGELFPVIADHDFYAPCPNTARGTAIATIRDWNDQREQSGLFPSFGLAKLLALDDTGKPISDKCLLEKRK